MIKRVSIVTLPQTTDPDAFWRYWLEVHADDVKKLPGLRKYVISRAVSQPIGEIKFWGMVETWWDSEEDFQRAFSTLEGKKAADDFWPRVANRGSVFMEEHEVEL